MKWFCWWLSAVPLKRNYTNSQFRGCQFTTIVKSQEFYVNISVTFDGSLRLLNRIFTNSLYDPMSQDFKNMELEFCQTVSSQNVHITTLFWVIFVILPPPPCATQVNAPNYSLIISNQSFIYNSFLGHEPRIQVKLSRISSAEID